MLMNVCRTESADIFLDLFNKSFHVPTAGIRHPGLKLRAVEHHLGPKQDACFSVPMPSSSPSTSPLLSDFLLFFHLSHSPALSYPAKPTGPPFLSSLSAALLVSPFCLFSLSRLVCSRDALKPLVFLLLLLHLFGPARHLSKLLWTIYPGWSALLSFHCPPPPHHSPTSLCLRLFFSAFIYLFRRVVGGGEVKSRERMV